MARGRLTAVRDGRRVLIPQAALIGYLVTEAIADRETTTDRSTDDLTMYRIGDVMRMLKLSRSVVFDLLRTGRLDSVKEGRTRLISAVAIRDYHALLNREAAQHRDRRIA